ncbi:MAG: YihY/virulence factor BrkB family protein [Streptosporangiaceae bacterium]
MLELRPARPEQPSSGVTSTIRRRLRRSEGLTRFSGLVHRTTMSAWQHRVHGLAAEVGFWALLSLAPLMLGMLGLVGYLAPALGPGVVPAVQHRILTGVTEFLTPQTVNNVVEPLVHRTLSRGRAAVASGGFVVAFWTGSTALGAFINAIAIAYGQHGVRGIVRTRLTAVGLYVAALVAGVFFLPLLVVGPRVVTDLLPEEVRRLTGTLVHVGYWPAVVVVAFVVVMVLYRVGMPVRVRWRAHVPGAVFAIAVWLIGSIILRVFLRFAFRTLSTYGPLTTPIAALLFFYISALAVLLGAELNAQLTTRHLTRPSNGTAAHPASR